MKEICVFNNSSNAAIYGIGTYIKEYLVCLNKLGVRINLITLVDTIGDITVKDDEEIRLILIPFFVFLKAHSFNRNVCHLLRLYIEDSRDLIFHFNYIYHSSLIAGIKKYFPLSKTVFTIHYLQWSSELNGNISLYKHIIAQRKEQAFLDEYKDLLKNYDDEKLMFEQLDAIVCLSEDTLALLANEYAIDKNKLHLIRNGLQYNFPVLSAAEKEKLRQKYCIPAKEKILLFVGRIHVIKGIFSLLSCFEKVVREYPDCRLVMTGDGEIETALRKCGKVWSKITCTGILNKKEVYEWYQIADLAIFPSFYEECSYAGIEMMAHGLPVIASDGYGVKNMFHQNAIITPIGTMDQLDQYEEKLKENILKALKSEKLQIKLSNRSKEVFYSIYEINKMISGYKNLFFSFF